MKKVLVESDFKPRRNSIKKPLEIVQAVTNLRNMDENIKTYINIDLHQNVLKSISSGLNMNNLKISSQDIIEFSTCQNIEKAQNNLIGLIVKVNKIDEDTEFLDEFDALIVDVHYDNKNTVRLIPISYDISIASEKSIIVETPPANLILNSSKFSKFALLTEFEISMFTDNVDLKSNSGFFTKDEMQKIINYADTSSINYLNLSYYNIGTPVVDFFDTRLTKRNLIFNDLTSVSNSAQEYILKRREKMYSENSTKKSNNLSYYDAVDVVFNLDMKTSTQDNPKIVNTFSQLERVLANVA
tara:strand:+ start:493 stop:1389 length:897 start_codon:yes stop_codon:yes gene_type:complete